MRRVGGSSGNEQLTAIVAAVLVPLLPAEAATLLNVRSLLTVHAFTGAGQFGFDDLKPAPSP